MYYFNHFSFCMLLSLYQLFSFLLVSLPVSFSLIPFRISASNMDSAPYSKPLVGFLLNLKKKNTFKHFTWTSEKGPRTPSLISALIPHWPLTLHQPVCFSWTVQTPACECNTSVAWYALGSQPGSAPSSIRDFL